MRRRVRSRVLTSARTAMRNLFLRPEETPVIGPRLQNHDVGSGRYIAINTFEHACGGVEWHAGIGDSRFVILVSVRY